MADQLEPSCHSAMHAQGILADRSIAVNLIVLRAWVFTFMARQETTAFTISSGLSCDDPMYHRTQDSLRPLRHVTQPNLDPVKASIDMSPLIIHFL